MVTSTAAVASLSNATPSAGSSPMVDPPGASKLATILIVTDEPKIVERVAGFLRQLGYDVRKAGSCAAARRSARTSGVISLVLAGPDLELAPGLKLVRWFRSESPATPVLLMRGTLAEVNQCIQEAGRVAVLLRPFTLEQLAHAVRKLLAGGNAARLLQRGPHGESRANHGRS